jgi:hypothetical protein
MKAMKRSWLLPLCALGAAMFAPAAELGGVRSVYVMPMSHGLDQYLANRLANQHLFRVVTDPKLADAVLSDHVGDSLQTELDTMVPNPEPVKRAEPEKDAKDSKSDPSSSLASMMADPQGRPEATRTTFGKAHGTVFLVDIKSRQVLWSVFDQSKGMDSKEMDRTASDIVSRLSKDLNPGKK